MSSGGDAPEIEISASEKIAAQEAVNKYNERIDDGYTQLEDQAITDARADHTGLLKGTGAADLAQQEAQAYQSASGTRRGLDFNNIGTATATSNAQMNSGTEQQGLQIKDAKMMGVVNTGQDKANNAAGAVMSSAKNGLSSAMSDLSAEMTRINARNQALGQVVGAGLAAGAYKYAQTPSVASQANVRMDYDKSLDTALKQPDYTGNGLNYRGYS